MTDNRISENLDFPVICSVEEEYSIVRNVKEYTTCIRSYIPTLEKFEEIVIDQKGWRFRRKKIKFFRYINIFRGFSLKAAGFGMCYVKKELEKIDELSLFEVKGVAKKILEERQQHFIGSHADYKKAQLDLDGRQTVSEVIQSISKFI